MASQAVRDWLELFERKAAEHDVSVESHPDQRFQLHIPTAPPSIGSVRCSAAATRGEIKRPQDIIWLSFEREMERAWAEGDRRVFTVVLDVQSTDRYDPAQDHFLFIPEDLLVQETTAHGNIGIEIVRPGVYGGPFRDRSDDWHDLLAYVHGETDEELF